MQFKISKSLKGTPCYCFSTIKDLSNLDKESLQFIEQQVKKGIEIIPIYFSPIPTIYIKLPQSENVYEQQEGLRLIGVQLYNEIRQQQFSEIHIFNNSTFTDAAYFISEGLSLKAYQFQKYKKAGGKKETILQCIHFDKQCITTKALEQLEAIVNAVYHARTLINEPLSFLTAEQLSEEIVKLGKEGRFRVQVLGKAKIEQHKMGGILAVNRGSTLPPTFTIMEHKPLKPLNKKPIVLIGKGVVYDTGGVSLKPTPNSMDRMKSDMSGAAVVTGVMYAAGTLDIPLHIIALVPATENRPGENAYVPGDVIKMYSGTTVEVLNTDAEGRMVLADALHYAKKYEPELVIDFATLTGATSNALGAIAMAGMGNASEEVKEQLQHSGWNQYERFVEFPLWKEYKAMIQSDIADLKNIGGPTGGAITAGLFLQHFTDYPWMHFDIAGVSHTINTKDYHTAGGTGFGIRMMVDFLLKYNH